ncbi:hypothetical protein ES703_115503 [subsurface metagenome]
MRQATFKMGDYAYEEMGIRTVTVLGPDYIAGRSFLGGFTERFEKLGGEVIQEQWFPVPAMDWGP